MTAEQIKFLSDAIADESKHFGLAFFVGLLAYLLISTILSASWHLAHRSTRRPLPTAAAFFIPFISVLAGLAFALLSHAWLDGFSLWYSTPLAPSLQLITH